MNTVNSLPKALHIDGRLYMPSMSNQPASTQNDFSQILMLMLLSSGLTNETSENSLLSSLMAPTLMGLFDQLFTQEVSSPTPSGMPIEGYLTQSFRPGHRALDFGAPMYTPVQSTMDGHVAYAGWNDQGYGNLVIIENNAYRTYYAHLSDIPVTVGQTIRKGDLIGLSGSTGNSTGPHLHYEIRQNGRTIDPRATTLP